MLGSCHRPHVNVPSPSTGCKVVSGQKHPFAQAERAPRSLLVGEAPRNWGSDLKCQVAPSMVWIFLQTLYSTPMKCFSH